VSVAIFSRRARLAVILVSVASFAAALVFAVLGGSGAPERSSGADAYSVSAIGHSALVALLRRLDVPVLVSRSASSARAGRSGVLVLAEPSVGSAPAEQRAAADLLRHRFGPTVLVLPKRSGLPDPDHPGWVGWTLPVSLEQAQALLDLAGAGGRVVRGVAPGAWQVSEDLGAASPAVAAPQLVVGGRWRPLVSSPDGDLVAEADNDYGVPVVVVADADLIANHGLVAGDNAALVVSLLDALRGDRGAVVIDETLHGYQAPSSLWQELFTFPLVLGTLQALLIAGLLAWRAAIRFGAPEPVPAALEPGKAFLVENTAELLYYGGHSAASLERYFEDSLREVGRVLRAPPALRGEPLQTWLAEAGRRRSVATDPHALQRSVVVATTGRSSAQGRRLLHVARRIHRWRQEMMNGPGLRSGR
jgi:hypothetical protein